MWDGFTTNLSNAGGSAGDQCDLVYHVFTEEGKEKGAKELVDEEWWQEEQEE